MNDFDDSACIEPLDISLPSPCDRPCFFVFGLHKSGSTLLNKVFRDICSSSAGIPFVSIPTVASQAGLLDSSWRNSLSLINSIKDGYCYGGFRIYPQFLQHSDLFWNRKKVWLIRDPRDVVVSAYYSFKKSHVIPQGSGKLQEARMAQREKINLLTLEEFVLNFAPKFKDEFELYLKSLYSNSDSSNLRVYRYEDIVFDKASWVADMSSFLEIELSREDARRIADRHDILPQSEDQSQHIRKVKPGDHIDKLSPSCIYALNQIFINCLEKFDYCKVGD